MLGAAVFQNVIVHQCGCSQVFMKVFMDDAFFETFASLQFTSENTFDLFSFRLW